MRCPVRKTSRQEVLSQPQRPEVGPALPAHSYLPAVQPEEPQFFASIILSAPTNLPDGFRIK